MGQIPPQWKSDTLENYFKKSLRLEKADEEGWINIEWPKKTQTQKDKKSKLRIEKNVRSYSTETD